jgi:glycosyltransferase involved in cell wall biosynthesis
VNQPRILAFAYACDPAAGSEPGAGWMWARLLARVGEVWVVTRANNRSSIESVLPHLAEADRLRVSYVDLPEWSRRWKRGQRGVRLYYLLWQLAALKRARELHRRVGFDLVWHLTLANAWLGSVGPLVGPPFVFGPVGGGQRVRPAMTRALGVRGLGYELLREVARNLARYGNPLARLAWRRAQLILALNPGTAAWFPRRHRGRTVVFQNAVLEPELLVEQAAATGPPTAVFAGRLLPWKAPALALQAIAHAPDWRLLVCGTGPERRRLTRLAEELGIEDRVGFLDTLGRMEFLRLLGEQAHALLFPSFRDDSPWVVAEALACGVPVVCLDGGGAALLAGPAALTTSNGEPEEIARGLAERLGAVSPELRAVARARARQLTLDARASAVAALLGGRPAS